jgi:TRAP-type C4-dicarboxylate transport system permease small subunit
MSAVPEPRGVLRRALYAACRAGEALAIAMVMAVTALVMVQVLGREVFGDGVPWADELARWAGLGLVFLAIPLLLAHDGHVKVDLFVSWLPPAAQRAIGIADEALCVLFCVLYLASGWFFMQRAARFSTPALGIPNILFYLPAALGMAAMGLVAIDRTIAALRGAPRAGGDPAEADRP